MRCIYRRGNLLPFKLMEIYTHTQGAHTRRWNKNPAVIRINRNNQKEKTKHQKTIVNQSKTIKQRVLLWPHVDPDCYKHIAPAREPAWTEYLTSSFSHFYFSSFFLFFLYILFFLAWRTCQSMKTWHTTRQLDMSTGLFDWIHFISINQKRGKADSDDDHHNRAKEFDLSKHLIGFCCWGLF